MREGVGVVYVVSIVSEHIISSSAMKFAESVNGIK